MINYRPTHKSYTPYTNTGVVAKVLTDVNVSETHKVNGRNELINRFYSLKNKDGSKWLLAGHTPRFVMTNATFAVSQATRSKVVAANSKLPHAYMTGLITDVLPIDNDDQHNATIADMQARGAVFIGYNPYKINAFVVTPSKNLPADCSQLQALTTASELYAFEDGILAII